MKRIILIGLLLAATKIYSQSLATTTVSPIGVMSATCRGTYSGSVGTVTLQYNTIDDFTGIAGEDFFVASATKSGGVNLTASISGLDYGQLYYYRFRGSTGPIYSPTPNKSFTTKSFTQASNIVFSNIQSTSVTVSWTNGTSDGQIVVVKEGSAVDYDPEDGIQYTPDPNYGDGEELGTGNFVVYYSTGSNTTITGLTAGNTYHFKVYSFASNGGSPVYLLDNATGNPNSVTIIAEPTTQATSLNTTSVAQTSFTANWTRGNGDSILVVVKASTINNNPVDGTKYTANSVFGSGSNIDGGYVVYKGTGTSVAITGLSAGTTYSIRAYEYNSDGPSPNYLTSANGTNPITQATTSAEPTTQSSLITFPSYGTTSMTINWTSGNGTSRIVAVRETDQGTITNPSDNSTYTASTDWAAKGTQLGTSGYYTVYNGNSNSVSLTNLAVGTTYWVQVFEYNNGAGSEDYYTATDTNNPNSKATLKTAPSVQATDLVFSNIAATSMTVSWTRPNSGGGDFCLVVAESGGDANSPTDGTDYEADAAFGSGTPTLTGTGTSYAVYEGTGSTVNITNLVLGNTYHFKVYEFNNTGTGNTKYLVTDGTSGNPASQITLGPATWDGSTSTNWNTASNWDINGIPSSTRSVIIPSVTNQPIIPTGETYTINDITINAGASLTINGTGDLNVLTTALLKSPTSSGAAGQVVITDNAGLFDVSGTSTMERYYTNNLNWRYVSSPLTTPDITDWWGFYVNSWDASVQEFDTTLTEFSSISVMQGLSVVDSLGAETLIFDGAFNNGNKSIGVTSIGGENFGWNLVGNPYPSAIDWGSGTGITRTNINNAAYIYNSSNGTYTTCTSPCIIAAGQGFFVHADANSTLSFTNACRIASTQTFQKNGLIEQPRIKLEAKNSFYTTEAIVTFEPNASASYDTEYDAFKLMSTNDTISDIYTIISSGTKLAINAHNTEVLNNLPIDGLIIPIGLTTGINGNIEISATGNSYFPTSVFVYLHDKQLGKYIDLREDSYNLFTPLNTNSRFELIVTQTAVAIKEMKNSSSDIFIYTYKKTTFIKSTLFEQNKGVIQVFDIMGRLIIAKPVQNTNIQEININISGTYIIKIIVNNSITTQKVVVE